MIKHIVMWKLKELAEGAVKQENAAKIKVLLEGLKDKITEIEKAEVGININDSDAAYDVVLYSEFKDMQALDTYQKHPEHMKAGEFIGKVRESRVVVDYHI